jgi:hypothetical protein
MPGTKPRAVSFVAAALWAVSPAYAQQVQLSADEHIEAGELSAQPHPTRGSIHPRGTYAGVKPGGNEPPAVAATPSSTPALVTWPGFQMRPDGSSRVFLQSTAPITVTPSQQGNLLRLDLGEIRVSGETNQFALVTRFFDTPVTRVQLKGGKRTVLEIELRAAAQPTISSERAQSGFHFTYIDFPKGSYLTKAAPAAGSPAAAAPAPAAQPKVPDHFDDSPPAPPEPSGSVKGGASATGGTAPKAKAGGSAGFKL